jgi:hydrogenase small subunit
MFRFFKENKQMNISRREFLHTAAGMAGVLGLQASGLLKLKEALANPAGPTVIWLQGQSCTGCSVSLLNSVFYTTIDDLLINKLNLEYHPNIAASAGDRALSPATSPRPSSNQLGAICDQWLITSPNQSFDLNADGKVNFMDYAALAQKNFILVVEGAVPAGANGGYCEIGNNLTMLDAVGKFGAAADMIIAVGTCASYGGIPAAAPNPTGALSVKGALTSLGIQKSVINIPGCPIHPDWLVGTIVNILSGKTINLDANGRPTDFFGTLVHTNCPNLSLFNSSYSGNTGHAGGNSCLTCHTRTDSHVPNPRSLGTAGCLFALGCKGRQTYCDCPTRKWNSPAANTSGVSWCVQAGSPCFGCTEPTFPDGMSPFYTLNGPGAIDD